MIETAFLAVASALKNPEDSIDLFSKLPWEDSEDLKAKIQKIADDYYEGNRSKIGKESINAVKS